MNCSAIVLKFGSLLVNSEITWRFRVQTVTCTSFTDWNLMVDVIGLEFNKGEVHGKMGFLVLTVQFLQSGTGLTSFRLKIR